jgi:hypothetical protein
VAGKVLPAAVLQLPVIVEPELKTIVPLVSANPPMLPPLKGLIVTLLVVIWALVVACTAGVPLSVVFGTIAQDPPVTVTELPETVQVWPAAMSDRPHVPKTASAPSPTHRRA